MSAFLCHPSGGVRVWLIAVDSIVFSIYFAVMLYNDFFGVFSKSAYTYPSETGIGSPLVSCLLTPPH